MECASISRRRQKHRQTKYKLCIFCSKPWFFPAECKAIVNSIHDLVIHDCLIPDILNIVSKYIDMPNRKSHATRRNIHGICDICMHNLTNPRRFYKTLDEAIYKLCSFNHEMVFNKNRFNNIKNCPKCLDWIFANMVVPHSLFNITDEGIKSLPFTDLNFCYRSIKTPLGW